MRQGIAGLGLAAAIALLPLASLAQSAGEAKMPSEAEVVAALHAKEAEIGPAKQTFVEQQLALTPEQLARFRPIYAEHQSALKRFNQRRLDNVVAYSRAYNADTLGDADAHKLALEALAIEREETFELEMTYAKARTVLPPRKAVHYLQIESKLRALVRFKQAAAVPVAKVK